MWRLQNCGNAELIHYLLCGSAINVSRFGNHHIQISDSSISKLHAHFSLSHEESNLKNSKRLPEVILSDLKSSNGSFLFRNKRCEKLVPNTPKILADGDEIRFGKNSLWKLTYKPLVVSSSAITNPQVKDKLKKDLVLLGGHMLKDWTSACSLLIMVDLVLTVKAVCALTSGAHIVTPSYLTDMISAITAKKDLPYPNQYLPPLKEPSINASEVSFAPDPERSKLFSGKVFIFQTDKSRLKMQSAILGAGGTCVVLNQTNVANITSKNHILVKDSDFRQNSELSEVIQKAIQLLRENNFSMIPESDIGLSIAYKSVEKYCNPAFKINGILRPRSNMSQRSENFVVYATETQDETEDVIFNPISRTTIKESGESSKTKEPSLPCRPASGVTINAVNLSVTNQSEKVSTHDLSNTVLFPPSEVMEEKENLGKRKRSPNNEKHSPLSKRSLRFRNRKPDAATVANADDMDCEQDEVDRSGNFNPGYFSTQRESALRRDPEKMHEKEKFISPIGVPITRKNVRITPGPSPEKSPDKKTDAETLSDLGSSIPKSIPFDPFTLPSIRPNDFKTHEESDSIEDNDEPTQPFEDSVIVTSPDKGADCDESWLRRETVKKSEKTMNRKENGRVSRSKEDFQPVPGRTTTTTTKNEEREFALPARTDGIRRRRSRLDEEVQVNTAKRIKVEPQELQPVTSITKPAPAPTIKRSLSEVENAAKEVQRSKKEVKSDEENMQSFLSKSMIVKQENPPDAVSKLGETFEKSLVVVEFVSLIKVITPLSTVNVTSNGLPNFKKFKKVLHGANSGQTEAHILPRIIGGNDLACDTNRNHRMDSFLETQPGLQEELEQRDRENRTAENDNFDSAFNLPISSSRQRKRGRI